MSRPSVLGIAFALLATLVSVGPSARAEGPTYSSYELGVIQDALERTGGAIDNAPAGKRISRIDVVRLEVFDESDPVPDLANIFHTTTREHVIRRELLFREGQLYDAGRIEESARNLRLLRQVSLVLIVPVDDGEPGRVRLLVITKDVWSLRLNSDFEIAGDELNYLLLNPMEENLGGTHASVGGMFLLLPHTYSAGLVLSHTRLFGTRLFGSSSYNLVFNRQSGDREGAYGHFAYGLPQYSVHQRWAFNTAVYFSDILARINVANRGPRRRLFGLPGDTARPSMLQPSRTLFIYDAERYVGGTEVTRSFGVQHKLDLTFGVEADRRYYRPHIPGDALAESVERFLEEVPVSDTRISPFVQLESYENSFLQTLELETLGLQEEQRLGHEALLRVYPASRDLGSSRDLVGLLAGASYTAAIGDGLVRGIVSSTLEYAKGGKHQTLYKLFLRVASPRTGIGRFVFDGLFVDRGYNYLNRRFAVGGADRLRGYPLGAADLAGGEDQRGADVVALNTEFRSAAVDILSAQCGFAVFHDVADAADHVRDVDLKHSLGLGVRILFPQADRVVLRADWAMPLSDGYDPLPGGFFFTFEQAFPMPALVAPTFESTFEQ